MKTKTMLFIMFGQRNELLIGVLRWACSRVTITFDASNDILFESNEIWAYYMGLEMEETPDE